MEKKESGIKSEKFREGNISLILDSYDDLLSDFDPRPYASRGLSDDFLSECKKAVVEKENKVELRLLIPKAKRDMADEIKIRKRMKEYFNKHFKEKEFGIKKLRVKGLFWFLGGAIMMGLILFLSNFQSLGYKFLMILAEPAGWFFFWEGLSEIFINSKIKIPDYEFFKKMAGAEINFLDY
jgi:hypothetical protein